MKTLLLVRHAKSLWPEGIGKAPADRARALETLNDHARPLAPRGREAAARLAQAVLPEMPQPEIVLCSSALRARQTLAVLRQSVWRRAAVKTQSQLYLCGRDALLERLAQLPRGCAVAAVVAHNPDLNELALALAMKGPRALRAKLGEKFPTGALALLDLPIESWSDIAGAKGRLRALVFPKDLAAKEPPD
jgi:phosphohistidine phosphatase